MKKILCSPPKPTRMVVMQFPTETTHLCHGSSTVTKLNGLPTTDNILPNWTQSLPTVADSQRAPSLPSIARVVDAVPRMLPMPAIRVFPVPVQIHTRLPAGLPCKMLTPDSDHLPSTRPYQQSPQNTLSCVVKSESNTSLESLLVDRAIEDMMSLPDVVGEVALKQRVQTEELRKQQQQLAEATQKLKEEENRVEKVKEELQSVKRQTWLIEEKAAEIQKQCRQLDTDIKGVIHRTTDVTQQLELKQESLERDGAVYRESVEQMRQHVELVEALESSCVHHQTLRRQRHTVEILRQQKQDLASNSEESRLILTGICATRIQDETEALKTEILQLDNQKKSSIQQAQSEKDRQRQLKQDIQVLQKRNAAQLTRLRRQLKMSQCRNRQWSEQTAQLERTVSALKRQLAE